MNGQVEINGKSIIDSPDILQKRVCLKQLSLTFYGTQKVPNIKGRYEQETSEPLRESQPSVVRCATDLG